MGITVDVAGMYFSETVDYVQDDTIRDVLLRVQQKTNAPEHLGAKFSFTGEDFSIPPFKTIQSVTVIHNDESAISRQIVLDENLEPKRDAIGEFVRRQYPKGIYHFSDDNFLSTGKGKDTDPLNPLDPNKAFVSAWQYYIYDKNGTDLARKPRKNTDLPEEYRAIIPYDAKGKIILEDGYKIVLRLVTIFVRPTHDDKKQLKNTLEKAKSNLVA